MDVWPQNGWFLGVRRALFTRAARKRTAVGVLLVVVFVLITERVSRPDPSRVEQEQYAVYSAYLFSVPVEAKPLPVVCAEDPKYAGEPGEGGFAEIHRYFVSDESISAFSQPSAFAQLMGRKIAAPFVPINVFNNFVVRNLSAAHFTKRFSGANSEKLALEHALPDMSDLQQPTLSARFTKVGFNRDFSWAMFYAEVHCGEASSREYVYLAKAYYRGWYWYVVSVDRN